MPRVQEVRFTKSRRPDIEARAQAMVGLTAFHDLRYWSITGAGVSSGSDMTTMIELTDPSGARPVMWVAAKAVQVLKPAGDDLVGEDAEGAGGVGGAEGAPGHEPGADLTRSLNAEFGAGHAPHWRRVAMYSDTYWAVRGAAGIAVAVAVGLVALFVVMSVIGASLAPLFGM